MAVELGSVSLEHLTHVAVRERARLVRHAVPGMSGDLVQSLGRPSVEVELRGIFYGAHAADDLKQLRDAYLQRKPVDFFTEAVGEGYFAQVLIARLDVQQRAGELDQLDFACLVVEYVEPPAPLAADPLGGLDGGLRAEAGAYMDDVQNAVDQVSQLSDLLGKAPRFADPTTKLPAMLDDVGPAVADGTQTLDGVRTLF